MAGGELSWQLERKLRALSLLIAVLDDGGSAPAQSSVAADVMGCLLASSAAHAGIIDVLRLVSGPLQAELRHQQHTVALEALDDSSKHAMLMVLAATLGLLARLLQGSHGRRCALHDALLSAGPDSGVWCIATCMILHAEIVDDAEVVPFHARSPTKYHDVGDLEREVVATAFGSDEMKTTLPLCPVDVPSIGPLAARCLALMCHAAAPAEEPSSELFPSLSPLAPSMSRTLEVWLAAATGASSDVIARAVQEDMADLSTDIGMDATTDCASAALQLLGAAAESQHLLFDALCRGKLRIGEIVRVHDAWAEPAGGWGLVQKGETGIVSDVEVKGERYTAFVDFGAQSSWVAAEPVQLELCAPRSRSRPTTVEKNSWEVWEELKVKLDKETKLKLEVHAATKGITQQQGSDAKGDNGPLLCLQRLLELRSDESGSVPLGAVQQLEALQVQALSIIAELWRRPAEHARALQVLRENASFWTALGAALHLPEKTSIDPTLGFVRGQTWIRHALGIGIITRELAMAVPPLTIATPAARLLAQTLSWLAGSPPKQWEGSGAASLAATLVTKPTPEQPAVLREQVRRLASTIRCGTREVHGATTFGVPILSRVPVPCSRVHAMVGLFKVDSAPLPYAMSELWAGGKARLLASMQLFDIETLQVRAWKLREMALRAAEVRRGPSMEATATSISTGTMGAASAGEGMAVATAAFDDAATRVLYGDDRAVLETSMLLDLLPEQLHGGLPLAHDVQRTDAWSSCAEQFDALTRAAARADAATLADGAHTMMVCSWRQLVSCAFQRSDVARPPAPAILDGSIQAPAWLNGVSESRPLESAMQTRISQLKREQEAWADRCASARQMCRTLSAAAELLTQQALALRSAPALAWTLVDALLARDTWQQKYKELCAMPRATPEHPHVIQRTVRHDVRLQALQAALDDSQLLRSDAGAGSQLLHKVTTHLCISLEKMAAKPAGPLSTSAATTLVTQTIAALRRGDELLKQLATGKEQPLTSQTEHPAALPAQLALLSAQLVQKARPFGMADALLTAEVNARGVCRLLDGEAGAASLVPSTFSQPVVDSVDTGGAVQLLRLAAAASMPNGEGSELSRHEYMCSALSRLACARESMLQHAAATAAANASDNAVHTRDSEERVALLQWLGSASPATIGAWNAAAQVHASLMRQSNHARIGTTGSAQGMEGQIEKVVDALLNEQLDEGVGALAECHDQRAAAGEAADAGRKLWSRVDCCAKLLALLSAMQDVDESQQRQAAASLSSALKELGPAPLQSSDPAALVHMAAQTLGACEEAAACEGGLQGAVGDDTTDTLETRAAGVQEVISVLALALHHEQSASKRGLSSLPRAGSTLSVLIHPGTAFTLSFAQQGETSARRLDRHGWFSDASGHMVERAPAALCRVLWPASADAPLERVSSSWAERLPEALSALAVSVGDHLVKHAQADQEGTRSCEAASLLLCTTKALLAIKWPTSGHSTLLPLVARAVVAMPPAEHRPLLSEPLLGCLLLLLRRTPAATLPPADVAPLIPRLTADLAYLTSHGMCANVHAHVLAFLLPVSGCVADDQGVASATLLMNAALAHPAGSGDGYLLTALLRTVQSPFAAQLLDAGLVCVRVLQLGAVSSHAAIHPPN